MPYQGTSAEKSAFRPTLGNIYSGSGVYRRVILLEVA
jgi:hypothetical protein